MAAQKGSRVGARGRRESEGSEGGGEKGWICGRRGGAAGWGWVSPAGPHSAETPQDPL